MNSLCPIIGLVALMAAGFCGLLAFSSGQQGNCAGLAVLLTILLCLLACVFFGAALF